MADALAARAAAAETVLSRVKVLSGRAAQLDASLRVLEQDLCFVADEISALRAAAPPHDPARRTLSAATAVLYGSGPGGDLRGLLRPPPPGPFMELMLGSATRVQLVRPEARLRLKARVLLPVPGRHHAAARAAAVSPAGPARDPFPLRICPRGSPRRLLGVAVVVLHHVGPKRARAPHQRLVRALLVDPPPLLLLRRVGSPLRHTHAVSFSSTGICAAALTWPPSPVRSEFSTAFCVWSAAQGCVFWLQNSYQRKRTYTRIALGRASAMDVASGEAGGGGAGASLRLLFPALFALQFSQLFIASRLLLSVASGPSPAWWGEWQAVVVGSLLLIQALGNFVATTRSLFEKQKSASALHAKAG